MNFVIKSKKKAKKKLVKKNTIKKAKKRIKRNKFSKKYNKKKNKSRKLIGGAPSGYPDIPRPDIPRPRPDIPRPRPDSPRARPSSIPYFSTTPSFQNQRIPSSRLPSPEQLPSPISDDNNDSTIDNEAIHKLIKDLEKELQCQISLELMEDPVILLDTYTYDRPKITAWFNDNCKSPYPNRDIKCESPNRIPLNLTNDNVYNLNEDEDLQSGGMKFALSRSKRLNKEIDELVRYIMQLESIKKKLQSANSILIRENSILKNKWNVKSSSLMIPNRTVKNVIDIIKNFKKTHNIIVD